MVDINRFGTSSLSLIGIISSSICFICILFYIFILPSKFKNELNLVLFYITIADLISSLGLIFGFANDRTNLCWFQGFLTNVGPLASIFWTLRISIIVLQIIYQKSNNSNNNGNNNNIQIKTSLYWHLFGWIWPIGLTLLILTTNRFGCGGNEGLCWCFIAKRSDSPDWSQAFWVIVAFYFWVWSSILIFTIVFIISLNYCYQFQVKSCKNYAAAAVVRTLIPYPFIVIFSWAYPTIFDVTIAIYPSSPFVNDRSSLVIASLLPSLQGGITGIIFLIFLFKELRSQFIVSPSENFSATESNHPAIAHNLNIIEMNSNHSNDEIFQPYSFNIVKKLFFSNNILEQKSDSNQIVKNNNNGYKNEHENINQNDLSISP